MQKLFYGGHIVTMDDNKTQPEAVLVQNGRIVFVGDLAEAKLFCLGNVEKIHLEGHTLLPGFIDGHSHFSVVARYMSFCSLQNCESYDDILEALLSYKKKNKHRYIIGFGYDHNFLKEQWHPSKELLDKVSSTEPVCILHISGHMCVVNSVVLSMAGLSENISNPEGGRFGRLPDGTLSGYMEEFAAMKPILSILFQRGERELLARLKAAQQLYFKHGITTIQEGAAGYETMELLAKAARRGLLIADIEAYVMNEEFDRVAADFSKYYLKRHYGLRLKGAKIMLDGSPQGRSAWLSRPYEGEKEYCGYPSHTFEEVKSAAECAIRGNYQLLAHCNGDRAAQQFIGAYALAFKEMTVKEAINSVGLRPVMVHCQTVRDDQLDAMKAIGMLPSFFVSHTYYWGDVHLKNLGTARGARISPVKSAVNRGMIYNFHQDSPVLEPDMLHTIWCAVNRVSKQGVDIGPSQKINVYQALRGITINSAYAYHDEHKKGSITAGKNADFVILDKNPLEIEGEELKNIRVLETIKGGNSVYQI
ncbi:MAG: amidohydrolase [Eubacteriales bacterium]|nr:amidohydrolase [Eubacteriales bacterium]